MADETDEVKYGAMISRANMQKVQAAHDAMCEMGAACKVTKATDDDAVAFGGEVKALGNGKVGGYLVRFSSPADPDLTNDYFDASTKLVYPDVLPVLYHHGFDKTLKRREIGAARLTIDAVGAWAETQLNLRDEYEKAIYALVQAGKMGYSSGAIPKSVTREQVGTAYHIKSWEIEECSLTPTPAEPRNGIMPLKSLIPAGGVADADTNPIQSVFERGTEMTPEEVKAMIDAARAEDAAAVNAAEMKAAELKAAEEAGYKKAVEELKGKIRSTRVIAQVGDDNDGVQAFKSWAVTGKENDGLIRPNASMLSIKGAGDAFNVTTSGSGGALVPDPILNRIIEKRNLSSWVRQAPVSYFTTTSDHLLIPREVTSHTAFVATSESAAYDENEGTVGQVDLALIKYTKMVQATEEFLAGENSNWDTFFNSAVARAVAVTENTLATTAILATSTAATAAASQTAITIPEIDALIGSLTNGWNVTGEVGFLMKNSTKWYLKGVAQSVYNAWDFEGYPVYISDDMPARTNGLRSTLFANFSAFAVLERPGILVQRNPYLHMGTGEIDFFCNIYRAFAGLQAEATYTMAQA